LLAVDGDGTLGWIDPIRFKELPMKTVACALLWFLVAYAMPIRPHQGDGVFKDISWWAGPLRVKGYLIDMPKFDLGQAQSGNYKLRGLINIGQKCDVYLAIEDPDDTWFDKEKRYLTGKLSFKVTDSNGQVVAEESGKLGDYIWWDQGQLDRLYQLTEGRGFTP
jgi:hypothetical protein